MELLELVIGLGLITSATLAQFEVSRRMAGWPFAQRSRVVGVPVLSLIAYFAITWSRVGMSTWWVVPFGLTGSALLDVAAFRIVRTSTTA